LRVVLAVAEERRAVFAGAESIVMAANAGMFRVGMCGFVALGGPRCGIGWSGGAERWCGGGVDTRSRSMMPLSRRLWSLVHGR
jgi:hypothetical protein